MRIASIHLDEWQDKFVVSADFHNLKVVSRKESNDYIDGLEEMIKLLQREKLRHETRAHGHPDR